MKSINHPPVQEIRLPRVGDIVRVRVVGLGALRRTWHDEPASVLAVKPGPKPGTRLAQILWDGGTRWVSIELLQILQTHDDHDTIESGEI